ncbi:MAG TPA: hypothetical protein VEH84_04955 [Alphaproteobacteria bacterium]|nr:hypothetical protein [Alphaproteobacteria bacterium]
MRERRRPVERRRSNACFAERLRLRLRLPRSTVAAHLARRGLGRPAALEPKPPAVRYRRQPELPL